MSDLSRDLGRALAPINDELMERLEEAPSEADTVAMRTAIQEGAVVGLNHGLAEIVYNMRQQFPWIDLTANLAHEPYDEWAERYGDGEGGEEE